MPSTHSVEQKAKPVAWVEVVGKDGKRLRSFYSELFGWSTADVAPGADYGVMDAAGHGVGGGIGSRPNGGAGQVTFFIEVDDVDAALHDAERLGGKTITEPVTFPDKRPSARGKGSVTFAYFADPEGHVVGLCKGIVGS
jgi:predicted enzyme related to lactoylglutathione lyase